MAKTSELCCLLLLMLAASHRPGTEAKNNRWDNWWRYGTNGVSGPEYWGIVNPSDWGMCARGEYQSPVDINPQNLLFDPNLKPLYVEKHGVNGLMKNTGQMIVFHAKEPSEPVRISGGPLGAYRFRFHEVRIHFGDRGSQGSEHQIGGRAFPAEVQILGFNTKLYNNFSEATKNPRGLVGVSVLVHETHDKQVLNTELRRIGNLLSHVTYKGNTVPLEKLSLFYLLPKTMQYVTYEGSLTSPGCQETVTWIVLNKPAFISVQDMRSLRDLMSSEVKLSPPLRMANNFRPIQPLNKRTLRTNINLRFANAGNEANCKQANQDIRYRANPRFPWEQQNHSGL